MKRAFVTFKSKDEESANHLQEALIQIRKLSRKEEDVIVYEIFQSEDNPLEFYIRESWANQTAFEKHLQQNHVQQFMQVSKKWLKEPFSLVTIKMVA